MIRRLGCLLFFMAASSCGRRADSTVAVLPVQSVVVSASSLHGRQIRVSGWLNLEMEGNALYPTEQEHRRGLDKQALWFDVPDSLRGQEEAFSRRCVVVDATVDAYDHGHRALFAAGLARVSEVRVVECGAPRN